MSKHSHFAHVLQGDMGAVWQRCNLITAKELIKEICNPSWLSYVVEPVGGDKLLKGEKLLD